MARRGFIGDQRYSAVSLRRIAARSIDPRQRVMVGAMATAQEMLLAERARVRERIAALEREFAGIAEAASAGGTDDEHDPEGATLAFERQHTAALLEQAHEQLAAADAALGRLEAGRYGVCERCGQPIGDDRLAARPAAPTCVRCAAL
jgi:DnaK suppressor protein